MTLPRMQLCTFPQNLRNVLALADSETVDILIGLSTQPPRRFMRAVGKERLISVPTLFMLPRLEICVYFVPLSPFSVDVRV